MANFVWAKVIPSMSQTQNFLLDKSTETPK